MSRKLIAIVLATTLLVTLLAGCGGGQSAATTAATTKAATTATTKAGETTAATTAAPEAYSPMTFTTFTISQEAAANKETDLFAKALLEKFNVTLDSEYIAQGSIVETMQLRFAGDENPDVEFNTFASFDEYGVDGYYVPFDDVFDKVPNFRAQWTDEDWADFLELTVQEDGKHYSLRTNIGNVQLVGTGFLFRMSTIDELNGSVVPKTTDELYDYLKKVKTTYPDSIPISNRGGLFGLISPYFSNAFRVSLTYDMDPDTNEFSYGPITDKYRDMLIYLNKLYADGLISGEFATQAEQQWSEHVGAGKVHLLLEYFAREGWANDLTKDIDPDANWLSSPDFINAYPDKKLMVSRYGCVGASCSRISTRNTPEEIDRILEMFDWLSTEEGAIKTQMGEEGVTYTINDKGEIEYMDKLITPLFPDKGTETLFKYNLEYRLIYHPRFFYYQGGGRSTEIGNLVRENDYDYFKPYAIEFTPEQNTIIADFGTVVADIMQENALKFIMGTANPNDDAAWNTYVETIKKNGLDKIFPMYEELYTAKYGK